MESPVDPHLSNRILTLYEESILTDVTFQVGPDLRPISAHRAILASSSPVFRAMFCGLLAHTGDPEPIHLPDVSPEGINLLFHFIYSGELELGDTRLAVATLVAAKKYLVEEVERLAREHIRVNITEENVLSILPTLDAVAEEELASICFELIDRYFNKMSASQDFLDLEVSLLVKIISRDSLLCRELDLFSASLNWANAECQFQELCSNSDNWRCVLGAVMDNIRFPLISVIDLTNKVLPSGVLSQEELISIIRCKLSGTVHSTYSGTQRKLNKPVGPNALDLILLSDSSHLSNDSFVTTRQSLTTREFYGAVDFCVNQKLLLGGMRIFASKHRNRKSDREDLHVTINCLSEPDCLTEFQVNSIVQDSCRSLFPTLDAYLPSSVICYPGLWYRCTLKLTSRPPSYSASSPLCNFTERGLQIEFTVPSNHICGSLATTATINSVGAPPYCSFLNGFHCLDLC